MDLDAFTTTVLFVAAIGWSALGIAMCHELYHLAPTWRWKAFLIAAGGPAVWGVALYRGFKALRHRVLHHFGVDHFSCS
jgi:hypothetical protein